MKLVISNRAVSPWPFRAWLVLKVFGLPFDEVFFDFSLPAKQERLTAVSPTGKVPVLIDGDVTVWESLSIIEYVAEKFPDHPIWPRDPAARAHARSISNEMHAGFAALRQHCPMNMLRAPAPAERADDVRADVARIVEIWTETRSRFGEGGPFLYGAFSAADAMFAPVVSRFHTYQIPRSQQAGEYMQAIMELPAWSEWVSQCGSAA